MDRNCLVCATKHFAPYRHEIDHNYLIWLYEQGWSILVVRLLVGKNECNYTIYFEVRHTSTILLLLIK